MAYDTEIAAATVWMEASGEGTAGMQAVACVIANRLRKRHFGTTLAAVCLMPKQFSCWDTDNSRRVALAVASDDDPYLKIARQCVYNALSRPEVDHTQGALYYFAKDLTAPVWAASMTVTVTIGKHRFLK